MGHSCACKWKFYICTVCGHESSKMCPCPAASRRAIMTLCVNTEPAVDVEYLAGCGKCWGSRCWAFAKGKLSKGKKHR
jgi:hypothetical protein